MDDPDIVPAERNRAAILEFNPDGSEMRVYAYGIRNAVRLAIHPQTGALWCSVNERDALGDNLVPDYITHVQEGGFYGWPWWYMGGHQDPRHKGKHPELKDSVITPDVLLHPHNASLELTFYEAKQFPPDYQWDIFAAEYRSWNRAIRVGYDLIRVPRHQTGKASGEYQDFMTGFVVDNGHVWAVLWASRSLWMARFWLPMMPPNPSGGLPTRGTFREAGRRFAKSRLRWLCLEFYPSRRKTPSLSAIGRGYKAPLVVGQFSRLHPFGRPDWAGVKLAGRS